MSETRYGFTITLELPLDEGRDYAACKNKLTGTARTHQSAPRVVLSARHLQPILALWSSSTYAYTLLTKIREAPSQPQLR
jgi:hypothetical protein